MRQIYTIKCLPKNCGISIGGVGLHAGCGVAAARLAGSSPMSPLKTHVGTQLMLELHPGTRRDLVDPSCGLGSHPAPDSLPHRSCPMEATISAPPSQPQTFRGLFIFKCI